MQMYTPEEEALLGRYKKMSKFTIKLRIGGGSRQGQTQKLAAPHRKPIGQRKQVKRARVAKPSPSPPTGVCV